jgi:spermidine synthase
MTFINLFFPEKIKFPDSKFNKNISIERFLNSSTLFVDGLIESGTVMTTVWKKAIKSFLPKTFRPQNVLLLGLAGGCNAHLINRYFPESQITAIEIDPYMAELGKKYFGLGKVKNLQIIFDDAESYVFNLKNTNHFDLIMVDCFVGKSIPKKLEKVSFLKKLKQHGQFVFVNRLWWQKEKVITSSFFRSISPYFFFIKAHTSSNVIISLV